MSRLRRPIVWMVLGLLLERPSYGYEVAARWTRRFSSFLGGEARRVYQIIDQLEKQGLVESVPQDSPRRLRRGRGSQQDRRQYVRVTADGAKAYKIWSLGSTKEDTVNVELLGRIATVRVLGLPAMRVVVERYEEECHERLQDLEAQLSELKPGEAQALEMELVLQHGAIETRAQLEWAEQAHEIIDEHERKEKRR